MSRPVARRRSLSPRGSVLLAGVSAVALLAGSTGASARPLGGFTAAPSAAALAAAQSASQDAAQAARQATNALKRATQAIQSMQATQAAARDAARAQLSATSTVPNGLQTGGLQVAPGATVGSTLWQGAKLPTQSANGDRTNVTVEQTQAQAILTWQTFNVGAKTDLAFDQKGNRSWVALNRVLDNTAPSRILGSITADGSVYVINQNGIIFGGASQVNVGALIASTANISNDQFLSRGIYSSQTGNVYAPSFTGAGGKITVEAGALIVTHAPASVTSGGGFVALLGSSVVNEGTITTPKGQALLAAGDDFILRPGYGTDANTYSTTRGNEVAPVIGVGSTSGTVVNNGLIFAQQGDITLAGRTLTQNGILLATTSVNTRGTIHLLNAGSDTQGSVTLGAASLTDIMPELDSTDTALNSQRDGLIAASATQDAARSLAVFGQFDNLSTLSDRQDQSRVEIVTGGDVVFKGGSLTIAQGGQVSVSAGRRIFTESGATIDVSGVRDVSLAMATNNVQVNVQGNELRDSPINRDSDGLKNANVWIDVRDLILVPAGTGGYASDRYYTPGGLLEVSGYLNTTAHTIGEWSAIGGTITLSALEVIAQQGSVFDISGGSLAYQGGYIRTSNLRGADGRIYNIGTASADMLFSGIAGGWTRGNDHWKISQTWTSPLSKGGVSVRWQDGYTVGRDAGRLNLSTPTAIFEGDILADTITGTTQTSARPSDVTDGYKLSQTTAPRAGTLALGSYTAMGLSGAFITDVKFADVAAITAGLDGAAALPAERANTAWFDASSLNKAGLGGLDVATLGNIAVDAPLTLANGAKLTFAAPNIDINAPITAHGGTVTLGNIMHTNPLPGQNAQWFSLPAGSGPARVTIASTIDLTGQWSNGLANPDDVSAQAFVDGGKLTVSTTGGIVLTEKAVVDVSSGVAILPSGKIKGGKGGDVSLVTNDYSHLGGANYYTTDRSIPLILDGVIRGYGFNGGGTLTLNAGQAIVIGGVTAQADTLTISPDLFSSGFSKYSITSVTGMTVADGTVIVPVVPVYQFGTDDYATRSGSELAAAATLWTPPVFLADPVRAKLTQRAGADLTLASLKDFTLGQGASITVDPGRAVTILANGQTTIDGHITAPGGKISVNSIIDLPGQAQVAGGGGSFSLTRSVWIGDNAALDVSGRAVVMQDLFGRNYGTVMDGGSILLGGSGTDDQASHAFIIVRPGALLDASGAAATLDLSAGLSPSAPSRFTFVASNGGTIGLFSNNGIYIDGDLRAAAGGAGASGGTLSLNLVSPAYSPNTPGPNAPDGIGLIPDEVQRLRNITIVQHRQGSGLAGDLTPGTADAALQFGTAVVSADQVKAGGFDTLSLRTSDIFVFRGDVNLSLGRSLLFSGGMFGSADAAQTSMVTLAAPYVRLDGWLERPVSNAGYYAGLNNLRGPSIYSSDSSLLVVADLLDVSGGLRFGVHGHKGTGFLFYDGGAGNIGAPSTSDFTNITAPDIVDVAGFGQVTLQSRGDVRFGTGTLTTRGNLTIKAAQIYPLSGATAVLNVGVVLPLNAFGGIDNLTYDPDAVLTIRSNGGALPQMPASVFGQLSLIAPTIDQGGIIRAPLGVISFNMVQGRADPSWTDWKVILRSGSVTSASADGLVMPFGGTTDGITYQGADGTLIDLGSVLADRGRGSFELPTGVAIAATSLVGEPGSVLDLSGGGNLTGAGFIPGRGGSVDILKTALINANPANGYSSSGNKVYAILPGYASAYAPLIATNGAGDPVVGQQVTIGGGVPGLPAGTYTLLPSSYALLPGAYRVEVGGTNTALAGVAGLGNGSYVTGGMLGIANTSIRNALASQLIITPGRVVRSYSQYNEMSYSDFVVSQAAAFGAVRSRLPEDGKVLWLNLGAATGADPTLSFAGTALFNATGDGYTGSMIVASSAPANVIDVTASGATPIAGHTSISAADINAFNAGALYIGGASTYYFDTSSGSGGRLYFSGQSTVNLLDGAALRAGQVYLVGSSVNVDNNAIIDTRGFAGRVVDSTLGYVFGNVSSDTSTAPGPAVLAVANGWLNFLPVVGTGSISIGDNASLLTDGSVVLAAPGSLTMGEVNFGARYLTVTQDQINVGDAAALAAAQAAGALPSGWTLTQATLDKLLRPSATAGVPRLEQLTLTAGGMNFFGTVSLDTTGASSGQGLQLVINTPAIYGLGGTNDKATIITDKLVWNGIRTGNGSTVPYGSKMPAAVLPGGAGTGSGQLDIVASEILFGYDAHVRPTDGATLDRLALGFSSVNLNASRQITANSDGTLSVGQSRDASGTLVGGALNLMTPLVTASKGASLSYKAGGAVHVTAPADTPAATATVTDLGGTVSFNGDSIFLDTAVALPSGKLTLTATNDIDLGSHATVDLAGRTISFFDATQYSWGGTLVMTSANGHVVQAAGSVVDISAVNNDAGGVSASAANGAALFNGRVVGSGTGGYRDGAFAVSAQTIGDFSALNGMLNAGSVFGSRSFNIKQGDLVVGNEVKANSVTIAIDAGSLTILGTIDASGAKPGTIRLSARDNLTLGGSSVLDTRGTQLQTDSYGQPVDADNTAHVELTSTQGTVTLASGATIDMRSPDGVARGKLAINAPRLGSTGGSATGAGAPANATGGDVAVSASGTLNIRGAASIAVYGFASYTNAPADPNDAKGQIIDQAWLDLVNQDSKAFIDAAYGGNVAGGALASGLAGKLAGLTAYGDAFHLRPGVEIKSATTDGNLTVSGDVDLSNYRYGPNADPSVRGSGEPGSFVLRAGNNLNIEGSINDGFAPPIGTPDSLEVLASGTLTSSYTVAVSNATLAAGAVIPSAATINMPLNMPANTRIVSSPSSTNSLPVDVVLASPFLPPAAGRKVMGGTIYNPDGSVMYASGATISNTVTWPVGTKISAGTYFSQNLVNAQKPLIIQALTLPPNTSLRLFGSYTFTQDTVLLAGTVLPETMSSVNLTVPGDRQLWTISAMLTPGSQSWSMRFVAGADLGSADSRALQSAATLASGTGNVTLNDPFKVNLRGTGKPGDGVSVVRTGTGDLEILAGGDFDQQSVYGIYTAGTAVAGTDSAPFNIDRGRLPDGTVLGAANAIYEATLNPQRMYYAGNGGDVLLIAQGDIKGTLTSNSALVGGWLWRQGGADLGQMTAWGINFGSYTADVWSGSPYIGLSAFSGIGALGGGGVAINAGGNIGDAGRAIVAAVAGSGWVQASGQLVQTGGGTLSVTAGGNIGAGGNQFVNVRGDINVGAGDFGSLTSLNFGYNGDDPRALDPLTPYGRTRTAGGSFAIGDGAVNVQTRGDLAMGTIIDPGRVGGNQLTAAGGVQGVSWFTLWTAKTSLNLFAAGGDLSPLSPNQGSDSSGQVTQYLPSVLRAVAAGGSIFLTPGQNGASFMMPSPSGALELLAKDMVVQQYDAGVAFGPLSTSLASLATPFNPGWELRQFTGFSWSVVASNVWADPMNLPGSSGAKAYSFDESGFNGTAHEGLGGTLFVFGPNTVTDDSALGNVVSRVYAVNGDVMALRYGEAFVRTDSAGVATTYYRAAKPVRILAGGDIVSLKGLILHNDPTDVSVIAASGNIIYAGLNDVLGQNVYTGLQIAGPGTLEITAGKSIYQGSSAGIDSIGPLVQGDERPGASIVLQAGVGAGVPGIGQVDWTSFANLYLDPRNQAVKGLLADQPGKVAKTYENELYDWLQQRFGYKGTKDGALDYFRTLPGEQQRIFLRTVYYDELREGGREYNDPSSSRYNSYLRGREAIAALFPEGRPFGGDITLFTAGAGLGVNYRVNSGFVHTNSGGAIQMLAPAGKVLIGSEGLSPGADAGLITLGRDSDIDIYALGSILLGQSRIMTTFGGDILAWSAEGDINAGRGSKTTVVYTPPRRQYDLYGNIKLSPNVPSTGAGIATVSPVPGTPPSDVDLIAPLGTIDAGEAGVRSSGNVNLAALQIVNAANIQAQGTTTGIPTVQAPNIGGLTQASNVAGAAAQQAQTPTQSRAAQPSIIIVEVLGFGGNDDSGQGGNNDRDRRSQGYDPNGSVQYVGAGTLTDEQKRKLTPDEQRRLAVH